MPLNPFGNNININTLYPNLDIQSTLDRFGVAVVSRAEGQVSSKIAQGVTFAGAVGQASSTDATKSKSFDNFYY